MSLNGTYSASKIRVARSKKGCGCGAIIQKGENYLSYAPGQRTRISVCIDCAKRLSELREPVYDCYDVRELLGIKQRLI